MKQSHQSTKSTDFQAAVKCGYKLLYLFGKSEIPHQIIFSAEMFLVKCILKSSERNNFDDKCFEMYH